MRTVTTEKRDRRSKKLQDRVAAAIDSIVSESSAVSESSPVQETQPSTSRRSRNKCPAPRHAEGETPTEQRPTVVYGGINMHVHGERSPSGVQGPSLRTFPAELVRPPLQPPSDFSYHPASASSSNDLLGQPTGLAEHSGFQREIPTKGSNLARNAVQSQAVQTDPVVVVGPSDKIYFSEGGDCGHVCENCRGLRQAGCIKSKKICQYCVRSRNL